MSKFARQQGGTVLGIIIGLVIGLGIALAVALVITKTPMPFTSRLARPEKASAPPARLSDPNKPLYGNKTPASDPIQELLQQREHAADGAPSAPPVIELSNRPERPKPMIAKTAPAAAPVTTGTARTAAAGTAAAAPAADGKWTYYLQMGAFRNKAEAANLRGKLALIGVDAELSERQSESGPLFRVRTGPFANREIMDQVRGKLSQNNFDAAVVRVARQ